MKNIYWTIVLSIVVLFTGCTKDLDLHSLDQLSDETFWNSANDFKLAVNSLYPMLPEIGTADVRSDIAFNWPDEISNGKLQVSETSDLWEDSYEAIRHANIIISKGTSSNLSDSKRYVAEAKFFRAFFYFNLYKDFGGVPIIKTVLSETDEDLYAPRASREEVVNFILKDLTDAFEYLPLQSELAGDEIGRITKGIVLSLKARVGLFEGTWRKFRNAQDADKYLQIAVADADEVISSNEYSLFTALGSESYRNLFIIGGDDSPESILDHRFEKDIYWHGWTQNYDYGYLPTKKLADMYLCVDGLPISKSDEFIGYTTFESEFENRDPRMTGTIMIPGTVINRWGFPFGVVNWPTEPQRNGNTGYILYKFIEDDSDINYTVNGKYYNDIHLLRYAEVLLIYAEALFERDGAISNVDLDKSINLLRDRVNMPHLTNEFVNSNALDMRLEIRRERTIELALEGFRYDDLRRWKTAETELPKDVRGIKVKDSDWQNKEPYLDEEYQNRADENGFLIVETDRMFDPQKHYLLPLPTKEIALYKSAGYVLEQNPGW